MRRIPKLRRADLDRITAATAKAEATTSAEIVTVIANQSGAYTGQALLVCLAAMTAYSVLFFVFLGFVNTLLSRYLWHVRPANLLFAFVAGQVFVFGSVYLVLSIFPVLRSGIVSRRDKVSRVRERAETAFYRHNITRTKAGNGLLIYISLLERRVELLVDTGIAARVRPETWREIVEGIVAGIRAGRFTDALEGAVASCGGVLAELFPRLPDDVNELPDAPVRE